MNRVVSSLVHLDFAIEAEVQGEGKNVFWTSMLLKN